MPGAATVNALPSRTFPQTPDRPGAGLPQRIPGGARGPVAAPSRQAMPVVWQQPAAGDLVAGGAYGPVQPHVVVANHTAPFVYGNTSGHWNRRGLSFVRRYFLNNAGVEGFIPFSSALTAWTVDRPTPHPADRTVPIPTSYKRSAPGAIRRTFGTDQQLWAHHDRAPVQVGVTMNEVRRERQQVQQGPAFPKLTRFNAAASYGMSTRVLTNPALTNTIDSETTSPWGSY